MKELKVTALNDGQKIEKFIRKYLNEAPLSFIYKLFRLKDVKVNGKRVNKDFIIHEGDLLQIYVTDAQLEEFSKPRQIAKTNINLDIVYEDENLLIVNKPSGLLVHGDQNEKRITLTNIVLNYLNQKEEINFNNNTFLPAPCHRLDRNTSGLVIFAKNLSSLHLLEEMFKTKDNIKKEYLALVCGKVLFDGKIDVPLYKDEKTKTVSVRSIKNGGKNALTYYYVEEVFDNCSLLRVQIITGRTHQIRVHLSYIDHPILGDSKYGNFSMNNEFEKKYNYKNQFLHAEKISFINVEGHLSYLSNKEFVAHLPKREKEILGEIRGALK